MHFTVFFIFKSQLELSDAQYFRVKHQIVAHITAIFWMHFHPRATNPYNRPKTIHQLGV